MDEMPHFDTIFRPQSWTGTELRCNEEMVMIIIRKKPLMKVLFSNVNNFFTFILWFRNQLAVCRARGDRLENHFIFAPRCKLFYCWSHDI